MNRQALKLYLPITQDGPEIEGYESLDVIMPRGAEILTFQWVGGRGCIFAIGDTEKPKVARQIQLVSADAPLGQKLSGIYIATLQLLDGAVIYHMFDQGEKEWDMRKPMPIPFNR